MHVRHVIVPALALLCLGTNAKSTASHSTFVPTIRAVLAAAPTFFSSFRASPRSATQFSQRYTSRKGAYAFVSITHHFATLAEHERWTASYHWHFDPGTTVAQVASITKRRMIPLTKGYHFIQVTSKNSSVHLTWSYLGGRTISMETYTIEATKTKKAIVGLSITVTQPTIKNARFAAFIHGIRPAQEDTVVRAFTKSTRLALSNASTGFADLRGDSRPVDELSAAMMSALDATEHDYASTIAIGGSLFSCKVELIRFPASEKTLDSKDIFACDTPFFGGTATLRPRLLAALQSTVGAGYTFKPRDPQYTFTDDTWTLNSTSVQVGLSAVSAHGATSYQLRIYHFVPNGSPLT